MLIEFSVSNFRSFREQQTISMVAAPKLRKRQNVFEPVLSGEKFPPLLKACVIYGPNASGKSNLLRALTVVHTIALSQPSNEPRILPVAPFLFDQELVDKPSKFDLHFIHREMRYQFELHATTERIHLERLKSFPMGKESLLYERRYGDTGYHYTFGKNLEGGSDLHEAWKKLTSPSVLFIAQAVANSNEELRQLQMPHEWLAGGMFTVLRGMHFLAKAAQELASDDEMHAQSIVEFLRDVDVPISRMRSEFVESHVERPSILSAAFPGKDKAVRTILTHYTALGEADLAYEDESEGTKNLVGFWLPWVTREPSSRSARRVLLIDELDSSLHPKIVVALVAKHLASIEPSQLIFTTHDTHLMDSKLLRRDQFWITERDVNGATQLRSIHDFDGRESEDIEKRYYEGRYRGLPLLVE